MAKVDLDAMRADAEEQAKNRKSSRGKVNRVKLKKGSNLFRILPPFVPGSLPYRTVLTSFGVPAGDKKATIVPRRPYKLEPDPFMDYIEKLQSSKDKASQAMLTGQDSILPKARHLFFVIDRDAENVGPQLFETNNIVVEQIRAIYFHPDYGDISDPDEGTDITIEYNPDEKDVKKKWTTMARRKSSPLHADTATKESWLAEDLFEKHQVGFPTSVEYMEAVLAGDTKDFKGPWRTRPDGTPIKEDTDEGGEPEAVAVKEEVAEAKAPPKGKSATDAIKAMLGKK